MSKKQKKRRKKYVPNPKFAKLKKAAKGSADQQFDDPVQDEPATGYQNIPHTPADDQHMRRGNR